MPAEHRLTGIFGKHPAFGDFLYAGLPGDLIRPLADWLQGALGEWRAAMGAEWESLFDTAPPIRFWLGAEVIGGPPLHGVWMPSHDRSGRPGLSFNVANRMGGDDRLGVSLTFRSMDDFGPAEVARQIPALNKLLEARQHLANLQRYMNSKPKAQDQIRKLLNDPELLAALLEREDQNADKKEG